MREILKNYIGRTQLPLALAGEADNGTQGLALALAKLPDVVLLDIKMPGLDGIQVLQELRRADFTGKVILLTAYSDFVYMQTALKLQAFDYLLKPVQYDALLDTLRNVCTELESAKEKRQATPQSAAAYMRMILLAILNEQADVHLLEEARTQIECHENPMVLCVMRIHGIDKTQLERELAACYAQYNSQFLRYFLLPQQDGTVAAIHFLPLDLSPADHAYAVDRFFLLLSSVCSKTLGKLVIGISDVATGLCKIPRAYAQAVSALEAGFVLSDKTILHYQDCLIFSNMVYVYPQRVETKILECLRTGSYQEAVKNLSAFFRHLDQSHFTISILKKMCMELGLAFLKAMKVLAFYRELELADEALLFDIDRHDSMYDFQLFLHNLCLRAAALQQQGSRERPSAWKEQVESYLAENIMNEIALGDIARYMGITPSYFSALFKKHYNENFVEYVTKKKIAYTKRLLRTTDMKIAQISQQMGFRDEKYFFRVYKRYEGITPGQYREQILTENTGG